MLPEVSRGQLCVSSKRLKCVYVCMCVQNPYTEGSLHIRRVLCKALGCFRRPLESSHTYTYFSRFSYTCGGCFTKHLGPLCIQWGLFENLGLCTYRGVLVKPLGAFLMQRGFSKSQDTLHIQWELHKAFIKRELCKGPWNG